MRVFKFGGASLEDSAGVQNTASIIKTFSTEQLIVVVSAMGKTTNALERILSLSQLSKDYFSELNQLKEYHLKILSELFPKNYLSFNKLTEAFTILEKELTTPGEYDDVYDQVVSMGEIISSIIVHHYLDYAGLQSEWIDARQYICTDNTFREGKVDWKKTGNKIQELNSKSHNTILITQGFIGSTESGKTTTLGREGSDYSAAIFASCLQAESLTIWKDVPGVMSADPKRLPDATVFAELPFKEAAEMTYYGASVIHPKTIKPLANKGIPLLVKNFVDPSLPGTKIHECKVDNIPPLIVFKDNQCLVSCKVTDYTFVSEQQLGTIFNALSELDLKINVMQNSAISFSFCIDFRESKLLALIEKLQKHFEVYYNTGLTLITIKNYDAVTYETYRNKPGILIEQSSRSTLQILVKL